PVLDHRETIEDIKQRAHIAVQLELTACLARIDARWREIRATLRVAEATTDPQVKIQCDRYVSSIEKEIEQLAGKRIGIEARLEQARIDLVAASQGRKAIERVYKRDFDKWRAEQIRVEQSQLDEIALMRHGREK